MKKAIRYLAFCVMLLLAACGEKEEQPKVTKPKAAEEQPKEGTPDQKCLETIEKAAYIHLGDVVEDSYQESIDCELDEEEIKELKEIGGELLMEDGFSTLFYNYKLTIYDENNEVLDTWMVGTSYQVEAGAGYVISEQGKIKGWLEAVEQKHGITFERVCRRAPGKNYLQMLERASVIDLMEVTENNFEEGIDYELEAEDIEKLKQIRDKVTFANEVKEFDEYYYKLTISTKTGICLDIWTVDFDGKVYSEGYELKSDALRQWLDTIEEKSGLAGKKRNDT